MTSIDFIEKLSIGSWLFQIFPLLFRRQGASRQIYIIDTSPFVLWLAQKTASWVGVCVEKLRFRLIEIRDEKNLFIRLRIASDDLQKVQNFIVEQPVFKELGEKAPPESRLFFYLKKSLATVSLFNPQTLWRALLLVEIASWKVRQEKEIPKNINLFLQRRPWIRAVQEYGSHCGVCIKTLRFGRRQTLRNTLKSWTVARQALSLLLRFLYFVKRFFLSKTFLPKTKEVKAAVDYYGQFNLDQPEFYSDLFFMQQSGLHGEDVAVFFGLPGDPLDASKMKLLRKHCLHPVVLDPRASRVAVPVSKKIFPRRQKKTSFLRQMHSTCGCLEKAWIKERVRHFDRSCGDWVNLFLKENIKIYISWFRYDESHSVIAEALKETGGIMAIYQRALDLLPSIELAVHADVAFGYSPLSADIDRQSGSVIPYYVVTGYFGDHRFSLLREKAGQIRLRLQCAGAKHITAYLDENSSDDSRWHSGHEFMRENYIFLLEKVLREPWFGLILKPKVPSTLRSRLGPVADLLKKAEKTGRCYFFERGHMHSSYPPALAALSSDIAVHGHLCAATAGLECALAGIPTLLMDREGWSVSPLYQLGVGKVVFNDWDSLWNACLKHWNASKGIPSFGDWSGMIDQLDPFRDGRGAERMGNYLKWMLDDFKAGCDRETVMANAAERYCKQWGKDKIITISRHP